MPTANDYRAALSSRFSRAVAQKRALEIVLASDLYFEAGAKPEDRQMPNCCSAMNQELRKGRASVLDGPSSGQGPTLKIPYELPR